jgi:hypothetical protein
MQPGNLAYLGRWSQVEIKENLMLINDIALPKPSSGDLRGRQSVRATFKLSAQAIGILSIVSVHLGIKQKSIFDHLMEDGQSLTIIAQEVDLAQVNALERWKQHPNNLTLPGMYWLNCQFSGCCRSFIGNRKNMRNVKKS